MKGVGGLSRGEHHASTVHFLIHCGLILHCV